MSSCRSRSPAWPACSAVAISEAARRAPPSGRVWTTSSIQVARARSTGSGSRCSTSRNIGMTRSRWPSSKASSAAASSRRARCLSGLRSAARCNAVTATARALRRRARPAASSSSLATCSCVPLTNAARCQTRASGSARSTSASASCTRRRCTTLALWHTAERISGWRKRTYAGQGRRSRPRPPVRVVQAPPCSRQPRPQPQGSR